MALNLDWINVEDYSFNCVLLMERFQLRMLCTNRSANYTHHLGVSLKYNPAVAWYIVHLLPEKKSFVDKIIGNSPDNLSASQVRKSEIYVMADAEDFVTYTNPDIMNNNCKYISNWNTCRLLEMADFKNKTILDIGSGSGRLAFAAAKVAKEVYACEPVETLRNYLRNRSIQEGVHNIRITDGFMTSLPYPDTTFDIVMSGHVIGDDLDAELAEMSRVVKNGGWIIDCPGEDNIYADKELMKRGFEQLHYKGKFGDVYRYRKQIIK